MSIKCWKIGRDQDLRCLLDWCIQHHRVNRLLVVNRLNSQKHERVPLCPEAIQTTERIFDKSIRRKHYALAWPGTELIGHSALVFQISFDRNVLDTIVEVAPQLEMWTHHNNPPLPEDLCLYRIGDCWPTLVSVTHEQDGWIISEGRVEIPGVSKDDPTPDELMIPDPSPPEFLTLS